MDGLSDIEREKAKEEGLDKRYRFLDVLELQKAITVKLLSLDEKKLTKRNKLAVRKIREIRKNVDDVRREVAHIDATLNVLDGIKTMEKVDTPRVVQSLASINCSSDTLSTRHVSFLRAVHDNIRSVIHGQNSPAVLLTYDEMLKDAGRIFFENAAKELANLSSNGAFPALSEMKPHLAGLAQRCKNFAQKIERTERIKRSENGAKNKPTAKTLN